MGVVIPQVISEDRASGSQIIDGGLRFDSSKGHYLSRSPGSAGNRTTWTWSGWVKRSRLSSAQVIFSAVQDVNNGTILQFTSADEIQFFNYVSAAYTGRRITSPIYRDTSAWYHIVLIWDSTNATVNNRIRLYVNGTEVTTFSTTGDPSSSNSITNSTNNHYIGADVGFNNQYIFAQLSNIYFIDGQALDASYFGFTDPLTNTWRPKKLSSTVAFGTNGFYLPFDGSAPIGQDQSGRGNNWTPVNFGGSNTIEKATGALPILNTDGGGKVARVGVRTDSNASSLVLALPLVGIKSDFSNRINSGTSNKTVTINGDAAASSAQSNFYGGSFVFDGTGDYLSLSASADFGFSTPSGNANDFTIEWFKYWNSLSGYQTIWSNNYTSSPGILIQTGNGDGKYRVFVSAGTELFQETNAAVVGVWYHYALVRNGTTYTIYRNGVANGSATSSNAAGSGSDVATIGQGNGSYYENGYIQDFRIYKGLAKYTSNFIPASTDPDIVPDSPSGVSYSSNVALVPSTDGGSVGANGTTSNYLSVSNSGHSDFSLSGDFTVEWFYYRPSVANTFMWTIGDSNTSTGLELYYGSSGTTLKLFTNGSATDLNLTALGWAHYAVVRSGSTITVYVNGVANSTTLTNSTTFSGNVYVGAEFYGGSVTGGLSGPISNFRLTKSQALYTTNFTPPTEPLTTTSQGATAPNVKLLCCQSQTSTTDAAVVPSGVSVIATGSPTATNFNPFTVNINTQRGKQSGYCTLNPLVLSSNVVLSNGNLDITQSPSSSSYKGTLGTIGVSSGKWYWEIIHAGGWSQMGILKDTAAFQGNFVGLTGGYGLIEDGTIYTGGAQSSYTSSLTTGDVIGIALNLDAGTISFYKNGINLGVAYSSLSGTFLPAYSIGYSSAGTGKANFGQKPFKFPPPAGFQPLALANTPRPTIVRPDQYVGISTWTGTGATRSLTTGFKPDFLWIKERGSTGGPVIVDSVRGASATLQTHATTQEQADSDAVTGFNPYGFSLGSGYTVVSVNGSTRTYVGWAWKAGGNSNTFNINDVGYATTTAAGLTAGTIAPTGASVNTKSGFSIVSFTSDSSTNIFSVAHGLQNTPKFVIVKSRDNGVAPWYVYHSSLATDNYLRLNGTNATASDGANQWGNGMTSSVIGLRAGYTTVASTATIAYCWAEIPGFSKFGTYTGNGSADGPVVITGFKPKWIMVKGSTFTSNWNILDAVRDPYNLQSNRLRPNLSSIEASDTSGTFAICWDALSNGFKLRGGSSTNDVNQTNETFIYCAFAETPSFNLYGGQANAR